MLKAVHTPGKGRGVITDTNIAKGETIERAPVLFIPAEQWPHIEETVFFHYCYSWGPESQHAAFALGFGSLYNHSYDPAAVYIKHMEDNEVEFVALRDIAAGEEVTINYNGDPTDCQPMWFGEVL